MKVVLFRKEDIMWWLGIIVFWFIVSVIFAFPDLLIPLNDYYQYLIEGMIVSSLSVVIINIFRNVKDAIKDKVKEKKIFGIKFVWHRKYVLHWIGLTVFLGGIRSSLNIYHNMPPHFFLNFIKGGIFFAVAIIGACLWEGNPRFFEGLHKEEKKKEDK